MRYVYEGQNFDGTPEEIAKLIGLLNDLNPQEVKSPEEGDGFPPEDFVPLEDVVEESKSLRQKLTADPNYNPFPGVVPSKEAELDDEPTPPVVSADLDTGVELQ